MRKILLTTAGLVFVALAAIGVVLPGIPTTPFLLVAAACFAKSSPKLYAKLLNNRIFGPLIKNWRDTRSIPRRVKIISLVTMALAATFSLLTLPTLTMKLVLIAVMVFPVLFILRLRETESLP